ncbi:MAG: NAD(P)-dependent glycerol-3-phosphate dehydrogenase [Phycisphaerales bacterium]|nr:NAD(P)-dependent glycerol-3-phosphate dehydrogenase [Phycisphaerales bacterium]MCI0676224.1 NAD(P)-dependent glycerol-3-phosphate dehydrogenase [Phycisphaerales bacterium]
MSIRAAILGDGQMALVMADALAQRGIDVRMWGPIAPDAQELGRTRRSHRLPGFVLPSPVKVTTDEGEALQGAQFVISAIPTQYLRSAWQRVRHHAPARACVVSVSKGIEIGTEMRPTQIIADVLGGGPALVALSGPCIATELARRLPASLVAASDRAKCAEDVQGLLRVPWLRVYRHDDVVGVEVAGATKNIIALAAGMIDGLDAGANAKSALLARGLAEIARLGLAMGARLDTFFGVAGVGDLATSCFSPEGRNRSCGERLGRGERLDSILASMSSVVEGVPTTKSVVELARTHRVDMPITAAVHAILFEGLSPRDAIRELMGRELKAESIR